MTPSKQWLSDLNWQNFEKLAIRVAETEEYYAIQREGGSSGGPDAVHCDEDSTIYFEFSTDKRGDDKVIEDIEKIHREYICKENNYKDSIERLVIIIAASIDKENIQNCSEAISAPFDIDIYDIDDIINAIDTLSNWFNTQRIDQIARFDSSPKSPFQSMSDDRYVVIENDKINKNFDIPPEFQFDIYIRNSVMQELLTSLGPELFNSLLYRISKEDYGIINRKESQDNPHDHIVCNVYGPDEYAPIITINADRTKLFVQSFTDQKS